MAIRVLEIEFEDLSVRRRGYNSSSLKPQVAAIAPSCYLRSGKRIIGVRIRTPVILMNLEFARRALDAGIRRIAGIFKPRGWSMDDSRGSLRRSLWFTVISAFPYGGTVDRSGLRVPITRRE